MYKNEHTYLNRSIDKRLANLGTLLTILSLVINIVDITWITRCLCYHCIIFISLLALFLLHLIILFIFIFITLVVILNIRIIHIGVLIGLMNVLLSATGILTLEVICELVLINVILLLITGLRKIFSFHSLWLLF